MVWCEGGPVEREEKQTFWRELDAWSSEVIRGNLVEETEVVRRSDDQADGAQGGGGSEPKNSPEPLLVAMVMNRLTDAARQESPSTIMFTNDIMRHDEMCNESRGENLER